MTRLERGSAAIARWLATRQRVIAGLLIALVVGSAVLLPGLRAEMGVDSHKDKTRPEQKVLDEVSAQFGGDEVVVIAYESPELFGVKTLRAIRALGEKIEAIRVSGPDAAETATVTEVQSLLTTVDVVGSDLTYKSEPLVPDPIPEDAAALERIHQRARGNPLIRENLLAQDESAALVLVELERGLNDDQRAATVNAIRAATDEAAKQADLKFHLTGVPTMTTELARYLEKDNAFFVPATAVAMLVLLLLSLRRVAAALLAFANLGISLLVMLAAFPLLGYRMSNFSSILSPIVMVLATTTMIHLFTEFWHNARANPGEDVTERSLAELVAPAAMCTLTTLVGFASVAVGNRIPALREFGVVAAVGSIAALVVSFLVAALAARWRPPSYWVSERGLVMSPAFDRAVQRYTEFACRWPRLILAVSVGVVAVAAIGMGQLRQDSNGFENLGEGTPVRNATELVDARFGGVSQLIVSLKTTEAGRFDRPAELAKLEALERFLVDEVGAKVVISPADYIKLMHRGFFAEDQGHYRIPDNAEQVSQLLLLNGDDTLDDYLTRDASWVRLVARHTEHGVAGMGERYRKVDAYLAEHFPASEGYQAHATGEDRILVVTVMGLINGMVGSLAVAFLLIFGPILLMFGSLKAMLLAVPSNLVPVLMVLGIMGWAGIPLNEATAMIGSVVLGMVVDDTIHFVDRYRSRIAEHGDVERALGETLGTKGGAVLVSTLVLGLGLGVSMFSFFPPVRWFGLLTALGLGLGLVAELFIMPALILVTRTNAGAKPGVKRADAPPPPVASESPELGRATGS